MLCKCYKHVGKKHQINIVITYIEQILASNNKIIKCYINAINTWGRYIGKTFCIRYIRIQDTSK